MRSRRYTHNVTSRKQRPKRSAGPASPEGASKKLVKLTSFNTPAATAPATTVLTYEEARERLMRLLQPGRTV